MLKLDIERALIEPELAQLTEEEIRAIISIAYLAVLADGVLADEESEALVDVILRLYGKAMTPAKLNDILAELAQLPPGLPPEVQLAPFAGQLARPVARDQAYRVAVAMALSDLETNDQEFAFDQALRHALRLTEEEAEQLSDEVIAILD